MMRLFCFFILIKVLSIGYVSAATFQTARNSKWAVQKNESFMTNMHYVDKGVYRSEQPSKSDFPKLEKFGIKEVLNLRSYHTDVSEAKNTDIILHQVRMKAHRIKKKDVVKALRIIKNRDGNILIHCQYGSDRTGLIVSMYRIIFQGWTKSQAIDELKNGGYGYHTVFSNIIDFINNSDIETIKAEIYRQ